MLITKRWASEYIVAKGENMKIYCVNPPKIIKKVLKFFSDLISKTDEKI